MYAVAAPNTTCLEILLTAGLPVTLRDEHFRTVYHYAVRNRNQSALRLLLGVWPAPSLNEFDEARADHLRKLEEARARGAGGNENGGAGNKVRISRASVASMVYSCGTDPANLLPLPITAQLASWWW